MTPLIRRYLHVAGGALGLLGILFVAGRLYRYSSEIDLNLFDAVDLFIITILSMIYGCANIFLSLGWRQLLAFFNSEVSRRRAITIYGISQLAKYVPGNIFQFAGRQAMGMATGMEGRSLAKSTLWELGLIVMAGALFSSLSLPLLWSGFSPTASIGVFLGTVIGTALLLRRFIAESVAIAWWCHIFFLVASGAVFFFALVLSMPKGAVLPPLSAICGAYVIAWLAGLMTPGAPAGVGIREAVLLVMLGGSIAPGDLLLAVMIGRFITVAGDLFFFVSSFLVGRMRFAEIDNPF